MTPYTLADGILDDPIIGLFLLAAVLVVIWMVRVVFIKPRQAARQAARDAAAVAALGHEFAERRRALASQRFSERKAKTS